MARLSVTPVAWEVELNGDLIGVVKMTQGNKYYATRLSPAGMLTGQSPHLRLKSEAIEYLTEEHA